MSGPNLELIEPSVLQAATSSDEQQGRGVQRDERLQQPGGGPGRQQEEPPVHQAGQEGQEAGEQQQRAQKDA